jgi:hypothetical protein
LLLLDDGENNVFDIFENVAASVSKGKRKPRPKAASDAAWTTYFDAHRIVTLSDTYKCDLHSVALMLYRVIRWNDLGHAVALTRFVASLLFFRPGDPLTAQHALDMVTKPKAR